MKNSALILALTAVIFVDLLFLSASGQETVPDVPYQPGAGEVGAPANLANGMTVTIEKVVEPGANIVTSAVKGVGRLARNMTLETGRLIGAVAKHVIDYTRRTGGATVNAVRGTAQRTVHPRQRDPVNLHVNLTPQQTIDPPQKPDADDTPNELNKNT